MSLDTNLRNLATAVGADIKQVKTWINGNGADLSGLTTTTKVSLLAAINELKTAVDAAASSGGASIDDGNTSAATVWSSSKTNTEISSAVSALVGAAPAALDTLAELATALQSDPNVITALQAGLAKRVSVDPQTFTTPQQDQARTNILAASSVEVGATDTNYVTIYNTAKA